MNNNNTRNNDDIKQQLTEYRVRIFGRIPKGWVAVKKSVFNGKIMRLARGGIFANLPFWKVKLVKVKEEENDYKPDIFQDVTGADVTLDTVLTTRIANPINYYSQHDDPHQKLKNLLDSRLRIILKKYPYSFLGFQGFLLPNGPMSYDNLGNFYDSYGRVYKRMNFPEYSRDYENNESYKLVLKKCLDYDLAYLRYELDGFCEKYGLEVVNFECKKVIPSEKVQAWEEEHAAALRQTKIAEEIAKKKRIEAEGARAVSIIMNEAKNAQLEATYKKLLELGYTPEQARNQITNELRYGNGSSSIAGKTLAATQGVKDALFGDDANNNNDNNSFRK